MITKELRQKMQSTLEKVGIPSKRIDVYGNKIMITCRSHKAAERWAFVLGKFSTVNAIAVEALEDNVKNRGTVLRPTCHKVWRTWSTI